MLQAVRESVEGEGVVKTRVSCLNFLGDSLPSFCPSCWSIGAGSKGRKESNPLLYVRLLPSTPWGGEGMLKS